METNSAEDGSPFCLLLQVSGPGHVELSKNNVLCLRWSPPLPLGELEYLGLGNSNSSSIKDREQNPGCGAVDMESNFCSNVVSVTGIQAIIWT